MNDSKFPPLTPKRVVLGVIMVILFFVVYASVKNTMDSTLGLHTSGSNYGLAMAPQAMMFDGAAKSPTSPSFGGAMREVAMDKKSAYMENDSVSMESSNSMPPTNTGTPPSGKSKIVKTGSLNLLVKNVEEASAHITDIRNQMGGQPGNATFNEYSPGVRSGDITIWVPSDKFDETMIALKKLALRVENESIRADDVSAQFVDLSARLKNLHAAEAQYVEIMKRAGTINDILNVTNQLNSTRSQIEELQGQLDYLTHQVALSSIHISLTQEAVPGSVTTEWRPLTVIKEAMKQSLNDLTDFVDMLLVFLVRLPILLLNLGFWVLIFWILWKLSKYAYYRLRSASTGV